MVKASKGVLVKVDPSIKAIIVKIDNKHHDIVIEELDDEHLVVKESKLAELKEKLYQVWAFLPLSNGLLPNQSCCCAGAQRFTSGF